MRGLHSLLFYALLLHVISSCNSDQEPLGQNERTSSVSTRAGTDDPVFSVYDYCRENGFWEQFNSLEERIEAVQLSNEELESFSADSAGVYHLVVEYNFYGTVMGSGGIIIHAN